ncbi:MFS general substrate transporter [Piedraia hortae CBS 480.64]|uniref:MFS general substrate transporter n=1 Tax=Piedraia hortae CBS 480.64 TaxID=1314780 RepID=A0A6A7C8T9_9PEZI|nr:MFS general substrate transporter [Piedraia hortae CBS 480.64]
MSPFLWPQSRKRMTTSLATLVTLLSGLVPGSYAAGEDQMAQEWRVSFVELNWGIAVFTWGFAIAPMVLAPLSEIYGRRPLFMTTGILFLIFQMLCAVTPTYAGMIVVRFLVGCTGSTFSTVVGGVVSDVYHAKDRNTPMALFTGAGIFAGGVGPVVGGVIAQYTTWRWIFGIQVILGVIVITIIILAFPETRGSVLLSRKAKALNKWYDQLESAGCYGVVIDGHSQRVRWKVKADEERQSIDNIVRISLCRPFCLLATEPVVFFFSLWISFSWAVLYLLFSAIPLVFQTNHKFNQTQAYGVFAALSIASAMSTVISIYQERFAERFVCGKRRRQLKTPEGRLYFSCVQSILLPIGCFWFGWTSFESIHWIWPTLAVGCTTMGIFSIYLAVFNYLADTYHRYASSALAGQSFCRNMIGGAFPLFTCQMFETLSYQGAGSLLGGLAAVLTVVPWVLVFYGPRIRARSKLASEVVCEK